MTKPIAVIGTPGRVPAAWRRDTAGAFGETGHNTGNLAFQHATWSLLEGEKYTISFDFDPAAVKERARLVCVPAANFLYAGFDLGGFADRLAATGLPLMVLGLGAQAMKDIAEVKLQPGTERLLRLFGERCARIAVRGRHTAAVLERYGVTNFEVLGCPSNFINPDPCMGAAILERWRGGGRERLAWAPTFYSYNAAFEGQIHAALGAALVEIVAQDPLPAVALARGDRSAAIAQWLETKAGYLSALAPAEQARAVAILRAYFDAEAWLDAYRRLDGVIGSRIHGVNLGWQAGRAGLVVSYDLRTAELAETMGIPLVQAKGLDAANLLRRMDEAVERCAGAYDARRAELAARFASTLAAHDVTPAPHLRALAEAKASAGTAGAPAAPSAPAAPARAWGFLELYNRRRVAGWVASSHDTPPDVRIRLDGRDLGLARIGSKRTDVSAHAWSFNLDVPKEALTRTVMRVEAVLAATGAQLHNSPVVTSFAEEDSRKVLQGRDGFLFLQNDTNGVLDQIQGRRRLTTAELDAWAAFFEELDGTAVACGAEAFYLVAPNKECVFADRLPEGIAVSEERPVRQIEALVRNLGLRRTRLVYPLEALARAGAHPAYPRGDSHWSDYGAMLALAELEARRGARVSAGPADEEFRTEYRNADLLSKLGGVCVEPQPVLRRVFSARLVGDNGVVNTGRRRDWRCEGAPASERLLMAHDSFGEWLIPALASRFGSTTCVWNASLERKLVTEVAPTTILVERAERFLTTPSRFT
ncbi:polysaccharide pyruvyl transferase family protein [Falsiroseomonas oryzae]|uniref:polysaccharide pyruvyl transferase family protein n=1 Tax=Falsiroseomonas oryzae TaxID=2766473 RepID=UPI0022EA52DE|nr:polysaccharide pyruvyl transferase family protein [Roseomonas sp. MO-31]